MTDLSVVIPAYNEQRRLGATLDAVRRYLTAGAQSWEIIVSSDGSDDGTDALTKAVSAAEPRVRLVRGEVNRGKGHAVRLGVSHSRGAQVLICDADLATPIEELETLRKALSGGSSIAIGSRGRSAELIEVHQHRIRESIGRLGNLLIRLVAVPGIADTQCGFKLFDGGHARTLFALSRLDGWGFDFEVLYLCRRFGWQIEEVPVRWAHQPGSKIRPGDYLRVLGELAYVRLAHRGSRPPQVGVSRLPNQRRGSSHPPVAQSQDQPEVW